MIVEKIRGSVSPGTVIPKPKAKADFVVKAWGRRRGEQALVYAIPNHRNPKKPHEKGITETEFERAYEELQRSGELTHAWFKKNLPKCAKEGSCNYNDRGWNIRTPWRSQILEQRGICASPLNTGAKCWAAIK